MGRNIFSLSKNKVGDASSVLRAPKIVIEDENANENKVNWKVIREVFYGSYRYEDFLLVSGSILMLIGICVVTIAFIAFLKNIELYEMVFIIGIFMYTLGVFLFFIRITFWKPKLCPTLFPERSHIQVKIPQNPALFTVASTAMSTITSIGIRFSKGQTMFNDGINKMALNVKNKKTGAALFTQAAFRILGINSFRAALRRNRDIPKAPIAKHTEDTSCGSPEINCSICQSIHLKSNSDFDEKAKEKTIDELLSSLSSIHIDKEPKDVSQSIAMILAEVNPKYSYQ